MEREEREKERRGEGGEGKGGAGREEETMNERMGEVVQGPS